MTDLVIPSMLRLLLLGPLFGKMRITFCKFNNRKTVYRTPQKIVVHIASHERLNSLFTIKNKPSCLLVHDGKLYMACRKLFIYITSPADQTGEKIAYIISESTDSPDRYDVGTVISKKFHGTPYRGKIIDNTGYYYKIKYDVDNDEEEMNDADIKEHMVRQWKILRKDSDDQSNTIMMDAPTWNEESGQYNFKDSYDFDGGSFRVKQYLPVRMMFRRHSLCATIWCHRCVVENTDSDNADEWVVVGNMCT